MKAAAQSVRTVCPYCGVGCGLVLQIENGKVKRVSGDPRHSANFGRLCAKGMTCAEPLTASDRLAFAQFRSERQQPFQHLAIENALKETASRLSSIVSKHGPDAVALYVSGQLSTEAQYLANKLCKGFLRTNNIDSNSRLCMSSAASGYKLSLGADAPPGSYADIDHLDCALVVGANMAECHPILFLRLLDRKKKSGARIIVVDPRETPTAEKADLFLQIKPGTDLALLNGLLHLLAKKGFLNQNFIHHHTEGWHEVQAMLSEYDLGRVAGITGLRRGDIEKAANWIGESPEVTTFWTMGLNQSTRGTAHTNAICNLHLAMGKICRLGSGPFSLTGQPNAMGGREVGYLSHGLPGQRTVTSVQDREQIEQLWKLPGGTIRPEPGLDAVALFRALESGTVKAIWIIGTNPVASMPNRARVIAGLQRADLVIVQDAFHPTETSKFADILLPGALWAEAEGTMVNSERNVTLMPKAIEPPGEATADWQIISGVAKYLGFAQAFPYRESSEIFEEIKQSWNPVTGYDLRGMDYRRLSLGSCQWPMPAGELQGKSIRYLETSTDRQSIKFPTESGRAKFLPCPFVPSANALNEEFPFVLSNGRVANQWHTMTKTAKVQALNRLNAKPFIEIHPEDAISLGISNGDLVKVASRQGMAIYPAILTNRVRKRNCFAPIHWNDLFGHNVCVNATTSEAMDAISRQPALKFTAVSVEKVNTAEPTEFTAEQRTVLFKLMSEISKLYPVNGNGPPQLPIDAPFTAEQRDHLNKLFERMSEEEQTQGHFLSE